ncbi:MAG: hypothetical protein U1E71_07605 [Ramlibacter sp.]
MKTIVPRSLSSVEIAVIRAALERANVGPVPDGMGEEVTSLMVMAECECGCHSLYFQPVASGDYRVADGVGYLPSGQRVDVLVWASSGSAPAFSLALSRPCK